MKSLHITVAPEIIAHLGPVKITNSLLTSLIVMVFLITVALFVKAGGDSKKRSKLYIAVEMIVEKAYMFFKNIAGDRTEIIFPLLMTFFLCLLSSRRFCLFHSGFLGIFLPGKFCYLL